jgi:DNA gyrase subunit A
LKEIRIIADYEAIMKEIARLQEILDSDELVKNIIREEFDEILESYGDERRTEIIASTDEIQIEDLIKNEEVIVTLLIKVT